MLRELRGAREVIVSRGPWVSQGGRDALELLWEDGSAAPFAVHLVAEQTDRLIPAYQQGGGFVVTARTRAGQKGRWPGRYRVVAEIPCLAALDQPLASAKALSCSDHGRAPAGAGCHRICTRIGYCTEGPGHGEVSKVDGPLFASHGLGL